MHCSERTRRIDKLEEHDFLLHPEVDSFIIVDQKAKVSSQTSASVFIVGEAAWTMLDMQTPGLNVADVAADDDDDDDEARGEHVSANAGGEFTCRIWT